jgi:nitroreductase
MSRAPEFPVDPIFVERWSARAMSGEPVDEADLFSLFEAARWAPSAMNAQPWRFLYARAGTAHFAGFLGLLVEANRVWCARAGALIVVLSKRIDDRGQPAPTHMFDAGAAWLSLALQGVRNGLVVHGMAGFDHGRARTELAIPDELDIACMVAVGKPGPVELLPDKLRAREAPSPRRSVADSVHEGAFPKP